MHVFSEKAPKHKTLISNPSTAMGIGRWRGGRRRGEETPAVRRQLTVIMMKSI
jgi:hypothetical protein